MQITEFLGLGVLGSGVVTPLIQLTCMQCGATFFFNAIVMGIIDPKTGGLVGSEAAESPAPNVSESSVRPSS